MTDPGAPKLLAQRVIGDDDSPGYLLALYGRDMGRPLASVDVMAWEVDAADDAEYWLADVEDGLGCAGPRFSRSAWARGATPPERDAYLHGFIKFDGCANIHIDEQDRCMLHFCGRRGWGELNELVETAYAVAGEIMGEGDL